MKVYQLLPGYGPVYRWLQRLAHRRGRCVLTRYRIEGTHLWWCQWCGHRVRDM